MFKKIVKTYYHILDDKVKNWTLVVFLITAIILAIWFLSQKEKTLSHIKTSILESNMF